MTETVSWLRLREGGYAYAVAAEAVLAVETTELLQLNPGPGHPSGWLLGPTAEVPVHALGEELGGPRPRHGAPGRIVVLAAPGGPRGLRVDAVLGTEEVPASRLRRLPPLAANPLFRRTALLERELRELRELVIELDLAQLAGGAFGPRGTPPIVPEETPPPEPVFELPSVPEAGTGRLISFAAGDGDRRTFAFDVAQVVEVVGRRPIRTIPGAPPLLAGLVVWRGEPVLLLDLARCLGDPAPRTDLPRLLVARAAGTAGVAAFPVERVAAILDPPHGAPASPPLACPPHWLRAVIQHAGRTLALPDLDHLLSLDREAALSATAAH